MIIVLFEVIIKEGFTQEYLMLAASLREDYLNHQGFIRAERFTSLSEENKILSMSIWKDEESVSAWRNKLKHRLAQQKGRDIFIDSYQITVTSALRHYSMTERSQAPEDSNEYFGLIGDRVK